MEPTVPVFDPATQAMIDALRSAYEQGGWLAVAGLGVMFAVRALRMTDAGEELWSSWSKAMRRGVTFASGAVGAALVAYSTGATLTMALPGALVAGVAATVLHHGTEKMGSKLRSTGNPKVDAALKLAFGDGPQAPAAATPTLPGGEGGAPL